MVVLDVRGLDRADVLFRPEVDVYGAVVDDAVLGLEEIVGRLSLSVTEGARAVVEEVSGLTDVVFFTAFGPAVVLVFERVIPSAGAVVDPEPETV